jgi:hypothetical protein
LSDVAPITHHGDLQTLMLASTDGSAFKNIFSLDGVSHISCKVGNIPANPNSKQRKNFFASVFF